jgi:hypothetical protein
MRENERAGTSVPDNSQSAYFPIPGTGIDNLSTYRRISDVQSSLNLKEPEIFGILCNHASSEGHCLFCHKGLH